MRIGQLAAATGVSAETLRFYEKLNLIASTRETNGYRTYAEGTADIVNYIRTAQRLGFTLAEIAIELPQMSDDEEQTVRLQQGLRDKIAAIDARMAELADLRAELERRLALACPMRPTSQGKPVQLVHSSR